MSGENQINDIFEVKLKRLLDDIWWIICTDLWIKNKMAFEVKDSKSYYPGVNRFSHYQVFKY